MGSEMCIRDRCAAGTWLLIASTKGWPVSTTHSIVGSIVGFVIISMGFEAVSWNKVGTIAASWVVSPAISGTMAFLLFLSAKKFILDRRDPSQAAVSLIPIYSFFVAVIIGLVTARKGLKHVGLPLTCLLYTSPSPRDLSTSRMPSSA